LHCAVVRLEITKSYSPKGTFLNSYLPLVLVVAIKSPSAFSKVTVTPLLSANELSLSSQTCIVPFISPLVGSLAEPVDFEQDEKNKTVNNTAYKYLITLFLYVITNLR